MFSGTSMSSHSAQQREYFHKQLNFIQRITRVLATNNFKTKMYENYLLILKKLLSTALESILLSKWFPDVFILRSGD